MVAINRSLMVAGLEISNGRVSVGVGSLGGELAFSERSALTPQADASEVERVILCSAKAAVDWASGHEADVRQVAC